MRTQNEMAAYLFHEGTNYSSQDYLGVHKEGSGFVFRVWAPNAQKVFLTGDFNSWCEDTRLYKVTAGGVWETFVEGTRIGAGEKYKYKIYADGKTCFKADPYARRTEKMPETASVIPSDDEYRWKDEGWLRFRKSTASQRDALPMNVYELHLGSWKRHEDGTYLDYTELARELAPYVKQMGYTHIQLMPIAEYPYDASWGYQPCSFFAPTARYGSVNDFKSFIDSMHEAGIGVILDLNVLGFPKDEHGLYRFDGSPLYEKSDCGSVSSFEVERNEVRSFLISSALYWVREFHIDGLRLGGLSSILYLDTDKTQKRAAGIELIKRLNLHLKREFPDVMTVAQEDSFLKMTDIGEGLGFDMKWDMEWVAASLGYASLDADIKKTRCEELRYHTTYRTREKYMLSISHDEVVHGKRSFLDKMSGDYWQKFAGARAFLGYMMTYPAKKLNFMGYEVGHFREWDHDGEVEWFLLEYETHAKFQRFVAELNHFYLAEPALWKKDFADGGFSWIDAEDRDNAIVAYERRADEKNSLYVAINFSSEAYEGYTLGVDGGDYEVVFNSDDSVFGGSGAFENIRFSGDGKPTQNKPHSLTLDMPPLSFVVLRPVDDM